MVASRRSATSHLTPSTRRRWRPSTASRPSAPSARRP